MAVSCRDELIELFANNQVATISGLPAYEQLSARYKDDFCFPTERSSIELAKSKIEANLDDQITTQESAKRAIRLLLQNRSNPAQRDLFHALLQAGYRKRWTSDQQAYFDLAFTKIKLRYDYFLSFTNRYSVEGENPINGMYKQFIISEISIDEYNKADRKAKNLLAAVINRLLAQPLTHGFYFPHKQNDNSVTEDKLKDACDNCLVFVQLVQPIMFEQPQGRRKNYCFFEWGLVHKRFSQEERERHILFVVASPDRNRFLEIGPFIYSDYDEWFAHIEEKDVVFLPEMSVVKDKAKIQETRQVFQKEITDKVRGAWHRLLAGVPDS